MTNDGNGILHASDHLWDEAAAILSGLIGGCRYGLKIRVPHALGEHLLLFFAHHKSQHSSSPDIGHCPPSGEIFHHSDDIFIWE